MRVVGGEWIKQPVDTAVTEDSDNLVTSGAVYDALEQGIINSFDLIGLSGRTYSAMHDRNIYKDHDTEWGYINLSGIVPMRTDTLWIHSEPAPIGNAKRVQYKMIGYSTLATVIVWDENMNIIETVHGNSPNVLMAGAYTFPPDAVFWAFSGGSPELSQRYALAYPYVYLEG